MKDLDEALALVLDGLAPVGSESASLATTRPSAAGSATVSGASGSIPSRTSASASS